VDEGSQEATVPVLVKGTLFMRGTAHGQSRWFWGLLVLTLGLAAGLCGCDTESYSEAITFPLRSDPIWTEVPTGERVDPDPPGMLPLMQADQVVQVAELLPQASLEQLQNKLIDPTRLRAEERQALREELENIFGTPAHPQLKLKGTEPLHPYLRRGQQNVEQTLAHGSRVYRLQCQMCHGVSGDGRGPTAPWVNPHPRDYRQGLFKFQSVDQTDKTLKPLREDLLRTVRYGIEGTAMPAFNLLPDEDLEAVVSYVIFLSVRGEAELETIKSLQRDPQTGLLIARRGASEVRKQLREYVKFFARLWAESQEKPIQATPYPEKYRSEEELVKSIQRGYALFLADALAIKKYFPGVTPEQMNKLQGASCVSCHKDFGRQATFKFDEWGTMVRPANLTLGNYRGGRRPIDLYWRIHSGINGSGMNRFGPVLSGEQIWDLVNFVQALPYPAMMKKAGIPIYY
jgi:mono/diheme cytochrome c family protein